MHETVEILPDYDKSFVCMKKADFDELIERSLELAEFHHDDIRDLAKASFTVTETKTKGNPANSYWGNFKLRLFKPEELLALPDGTIVIDIFGVSCIKTADIDTDIRGSSTAYGWLEPIEDN